MSRSNNLYRGTKLDILEPIYVHDMTRGFRGVHGACSYIQGFFALTGSKLPKTRPRREFARDEFRRLHFPPLAVCQLGWPTLLVERIPTGQST